jgi:hypothetical protein
LLDLNLLEEGEKGRECGRAIYTIQRNKFKTCLIGLGAKKVSSSIAEKMLLI